MPRVYNVIFEDVSVAAAQDLVGIYGGAGKMCRIRRAWCGPTDNTLPAAQGLKFACRVLPVTVTPGTGGSAPTPQKTDQGDAAATFTARVNDTTPASTNGSAQTCDDNGGHVFNGYERVFVGQGQPTVGPSQAFVFKLLGAPAASLKMSGGVEVEEIG